MFGKLFKLIQTLNVDPFNFKKAIVLCCYVMGLRFAGELILILFNISFGLLPDLIFMAAVLFITRGMGKGELGRILTWRNVPLPIFAAVLIMFFGGYIIRVELSNLLQILLPIPEGFFESIFYWPENIFLLILAGSLLPGFTEEIFFRGIISRKFCRVYSLQKAILLNAVLFAIMHINPWQMVNCFFSGIIYGWIYWRYRSIWLCMFIHAYNNILATFMVHPYVMIENSDYRDLWRHPLWFDILGIVLFALGLFMLIVLSKVKEK